MGWPRMVELFVSGTIIMYACDEILVVFFKNKADTTETNYFELLRQGNWCVWSSRILKNCNNSPTIVVNQEKAEKYINKTLDVLRKRILFH